MNSQKTIIAADLFCGAGGSSTGLSMACADLGLSLDLLAVNHWKMAISTHMANHPTARHLCETLDGVDPRKAIPGGKLNLLCASPECTHHSNARGGTPCSDQSRSTAWHVLRWAEALRPESILVENVPEFESWGPIDEKLRPVKSKKGKIFLAWVGALKSLGYRVDWRVLNASSYGDPTHRRRLFIQARRGRRVTWPEATHSESQEIDLYRTTLPFRTAADIIDWSLPCPSINLSAEDAKKIGVRRPLADNTLARIEAGVKRYWGAHAEPFLVVLRGTAITQMKYTCQTLDQPIPSITSGGGHFGLVRPMILHQMSGMNCLPVAQPLPTITTTGAHAIIQPFLVKFYGNSNTQSIKEPLGTVTAKDHFGVVTGYGLDIGFRMLQPHELSMAMGFPKDYKFSGNRGDQVRQIGNAVPVETARALFRDLLTA